LWDDFSLGPIDPPEPADRWAWAKGELGLFPHSRKLFTKKNNAWDAALSPGTRKIAWVARRWAHEYCGFLEWLWRLGDQPCDVVDLYDVVVDRHHHDGTSERHSPTCLGSLFAEEIHEMPRGRAGAEAELHAVPDLLQRARRGLPFECFHVHVW